jgi:hypothetical protein
MADIGNAPARAIDARRRTVGIRRWRPGRPLRLGGAPVTIDEPPQQITSASRRRTVRVEEPCAVKVIGDRTIVIVRHSGRDRTGGIIGAGGEVSWPNRARTTRPSLEFVNPRPLQKLYAQPDPGCSCLRRGMDRGVHIDACRCPGYARSARGLRGRRPAPLRALYPGRGLHHILHDSKGALRQRRLPVGDEARHAQQPRALLEPEIRIWPTAAARAEILLANRGRPP